MKVAASYVVGLVCCIKFGALTFLQGGAIWLHTNKSHLSPTNQQITIKRNNYQACYSETKGNAVRSLDQVLGRLFIILSALLHVHSLMITVLDNF